MKISMTIVCKNITEKENAIKNFHNFIRRINHKADNKTDYIISVINLENEKSEIIRNKRSLENSTL